VFIVPLLDGAALGIGSIYAAKIAATQHRVSIAPPRRQVKRDPRAGCQTERVVNAVEDGIWLANQIYDKALLRFGQGNIDFKW
jgi:hypothetical protein